MDDRRRFPRADTQIPIRIIHTTAAGDQFEIQSRDLSGSGISCEVHAFLPLMAKLQLTLLLPDADHHHAPHRILCEGAVVRVEPLRTQVEGPPWFRVAIFFTDIKPADRQRIIRHVEHHLPPGESRASDAPPANEPR